MQTVLRFNKAIVMHSPAVKYPQFSPKDLFHIEVQVTKGLGVIPSKYTISHVGL